ncbi:ABC transporter permease [Actinoallomurus sp. NBC_01490]|uniref:ABC transporter permease n=1 Tax=Actinoallomurus sp. NBC_01490 TaxID=2903557 RepID=UPI002E3715E4|nr:ABC transporter permease [Actinoallomurus sp. NBC_01490]
MLRRCLGRMVLAVAGASLAYFAATLALDPRASLEGRSPRPPRAAVSARLASLGLDGPPARRYATWASGVARGDFGATLDGVPVRGELLRRAGASLRLVAAGGALGWAGGVLLGAVGACRPRGALDRLITAGALVTMATPAFALAVLLQTAAQSVNSWTGAPVFAWTGEYTPGAAGPVVDRLRHLLLPATVLALGQAAMCARYQRGLLLDALNSGCVRAAMARGLRRRTALRRHALRVTVAPMTTFAAYGFAALLTGTAVTEKVFAWHGLGEWLIDSIAGDDVNAVAACGCAAAMAIAAVGLLADLANAALDPRARP